MDRHIRKQIAIAVHEAWQKTEPAKKHADNKPFEELSKDSQNLDYMGLEALEEMGYLFVPRIPLLAILQWPFKRQSWLDLFYMLFHWKVKYPSDVCTAKIEKATLAQRIHELWSYRKKQLDWKPGKMGAYDKVIIDTCNKSHSLIDLDYQRVPYIYKQSNKATAKTTLKEIRKQGFRIVVPKSLAGSSRNGSLHIDQFISTSVFSQLGRLLIYMLGALFVFAAINFWFIDFSRVAHSPFMERFSYTFVRMFDPGSLDEKSVVHWFDAIVIIFGWILLGGFFIAILTNGYFERIKKIERGEARYKLEDHCVIIGSDKMHLNIIRDIRNGRKGTTCDSTAKIVIFTTRDAEEVRMHLKAHLNKKEENEVYIYNGERTSKDHLSTLFLDKASSIFVLGEHQEYECDAQNVECISLIRQIFTFVSPSKLRKVMNCYVLLDDLKSYELMANHSLDSPWSHLLQPKYFNNYDSWSSHLFNEDFRGFQLMRSRIIMHWKGENTNTIRFVIIGFNRMGQAILDQAIRILQLGVNQKVIIDIIDKGSDEQLKSYKAAHPGFSWLSQLCDVKINYHSVDIDSEEAKTLLNNSISDSESYLLAIAICFKEPTLSLHTALKLPNEVVTNNIPLLVRQNELNGLAADIHNRQTGMYSSIAMFGMVNDAEYIFDKREVKAEEIQKQYQEYCEILSREEAPFDKPWSQLPESEKWANRYKAESASIIDLLLELKSVLKEKDTATLKKYLIAYTYAYKLKQHVQKGDLIKYLAQKKYDIMGIPNFLDNEKETLKTLTIYITEYLSKLSNKEVIMFISSVLGEETYRNEFKNNLDIEKGQIINYKMIAEEVLPIILFTSKDIEEKECKLKNIKENILTLLGEIELAKFCGKDDLVLTLKKINSGSHITLLELPSSLKKFLEAKSRKEQDTLTLEEYKAAVPEKHIEEIEKLLEYMAETEHRRWMAERIVSGWNQTKDGQRNNDLKIHTDIKPYTNLNEGTKMYDRGGFI